ncbi:MAG: ABC transporter permease, partial [Tetragenococcus koreensis]|nr:ABC transporter permease [Tetragenococcus koreensis]
MRKKKLWKDIRRSITGSWGRFFSILSLMALGTFAFVGLKVTGPDMRATAEDFYEQTNLADMTLTSTWG